MILTRIPPAQTKNIPVNTVPLPQYADKGNIHGIEYSQRKSEADRGQMMSAVGFVNFNQLD